MQIVAHHALRCLQTLHRHQPVLKRFNSQTLINPLCTLDSECPLMLIGNLIYHCCPHCQSSQQSGCVAFKCLCICVCDVCWLCVCHAVRFSICFTTVNMSCVLPVRCRPLCGHASRSLCVLIVCRYTCPKTWPMLTASLARLIITLK
jgi:hypothetical protein